MSRGYLFDCETYEVFLNNNSYSKHQNHCVIIRDKDSLGCRYGLVGLLEVLKGLCKKYNKTPNIDDTWTTKDLSVYVFKLFGEITNEQIKDERRAKREARTKVSRASRTDSSGAPIAYNRRKQRNYIVCFEAIGKELSPTGRSKLPHQARTILDQIRQQPNAALTELDVKALVQRAVDLGQLKTVQDPYRIFRYYEARFHQMGLLLKKVIR